MAFSNFWYDENRNIQALPNQLPHEMHITDPITASPRPYLMLQDWSTKANYCSSWILQGQPQVFYQKLSSVAHARVTQQQVKPLWSSLWITVGRCCSVAYDHNASVDGLQFHATSFVVSNCWSFRSIKSPHLKSLGWISDKVRFRNISAVLEMSSQFEDPR